MKLDKQDTPDRYSCSSCVQLVFTVLCSIQRFSSSNGVLLRRHENNIGPEEQDLSENENNIEADDEDGTLVRGSRPIGSNGSGKFRSKSRVNGTSENKEDTIGGVSKILEKGKASLSRSKSELGEQHKKMISHWKFSKNEITEQNRKLLANLGSVSIEKTSMVKKLLPGSFKKPKETTTSSQLVQDHEHLERSTEVPNNNLETQGDLPAHQDSLDGLMKNLGLHKRGGYDHRESKINDMSKSLYVTENNYDDLEKHLENDYGEFEFIDEGGTLTRSLKTNGEAVNTEEHRKSMFSFSEEVFDELEKAGTLQRQASSSQKDCANNSSSVTSNVEGAPETYETYGAWRQKRNQQQHQSSYVSQYYHHQQQQQQNNNNSVTNNTSAKLSALIADQTLLLRHHKRRKKLVEKNHISQQQQEQYKKSSYQELQDSLESDHMQQSLLALQQQLENATKQLEGSSYNSSTTHISVAPLRRCSSLSQTYNEDFDFDLQGSHAPPAKVNGTSPLSSSPWLSTNSSSSTSSTNNCRYLYRGKFQPTTPTSTSGHSNSMNNNSNHHNSSSSKKNNGAAVDRSSKADRKGGPWQLRSNLSSFARRRRGSSTSLHTFSDNEDDSIVSASDYITTSSNSGSQNGYKKRQKPDADSVSLTGGTESSHR